MEFSSSDDDDDLRRELQRQYRRERATERGIITASQLHNRSRSNSTTGRITGRQRVCLPNGVPIDARQGTVYIPLRERYVHIFEARSRPEFFFGDGSVQRTRRKSLAPHLVLLFDATPERGNTRASESSVRGAPSWPVVTLLEAGDVGFFIFKEVLSTSVSREKKRDYRGSPTGIEAVQHKEPQTVSLSNYCSVGGASMCFQDEMRFQQITHPFAAASWSLGCQLRRHLRISLEQSWCTDNRRVPLFSRSSALCGDSHREVLWCYDGETSTIAAAWCEEDDDVLHTVPAVPALPARGHPAQTSLGVALLAPHNEPAADPMAMLLVGATTVSMMMISHASYVTRSGKGYGTGKLNFFSGGARARFPYTCWCSAAAPWFASSLPWVAVADEKKNVFECSLDSESGTWHRRHLRQFQTTPATALCPYAPRGPHAPPAAVVAGMRNGTIQLVPLASRRGSGNGFDATRRHARSSLIAVQGAYGQEYGLISVASNGEAKLWDVRKIDTLPVNVLHPSFGIGAVGAKVALYESLLAVAPLQGGSLTCVSTTNSEVLMSKEAGVPAVARMCFVKQGANYDLMLLEARRLHRYTLAIDAQ